MAHESLAVRNGGTRTHLGRALHSGQLVIRSPAKLIDEFRAGEDYEPAVQHGDFEESSVEL